MRSLRARACSPEVEVVLRVLGQGELQSAIGRRDSCRVVPLVVVGTPVVQVDCLPKGVVVRVEGSSIGVELVGEDEVELAPIDEARTSESVLRRVWVNEACPHAGEAGNLARGIRTAQVEAALVAAIVAREVADDGVAGEEGEDTAAEDYEGADVAEGTSGEATRDKGASAIVARVVEIVIRLGLALRRARRRRSVMQRSSRPSTRRALTSLVSHE